MTALDQIRKVSEQFYAGLTRMASGERDAFADVWAHSATVTTMHPTGGQQVGWEAVEESFNQVSEIASDGKIALNDQCIEVLGDMAYELGIEQGQFKLGGHPVSFEHRVTNIYRREDGEWKMVHHHADTSPAMQDVLGRLEAPSA